MDEVGMVLAMGVTAVGDDRLKSAVMRGARVGTERAFKKMRGRDPEPLFSLEPHVCRHCFGRLLSTDAGAPSGARRYVCSNCGASEVGASPEVLCCCGMTLKTKAPPGRVLTCGPNPNPSAAFPSQIVAIAG